MSICEYFVFVFTYTIYYTYVAKDVLDETRECVLHVIDDTTSSTCLVRDWSRDLYTYAHLYIYKCCSVHTGRLTCTRTYAHLYIERYSFVHIKRVFCTYKYDHLFIQTCPFVHIKILICTYKYKHLFI